MAEGELLGSLSHGEEAGRAGAAEKTRPASTRVNWRDSETG